MGDELKRLYIEPTSRCNLRCAMCFRNSWIGESTGDMNEKTFRAVMEHLPASVDTIFFGGMGEPLAHARIVETVRLDAIFTKYKGIKAIIHFAASKAVGESVEKPLLYYRNNLVSLINLLELMPKHGVEGIVFSSSCTVYGQPDELPVTEKAPIKKAESPYGNTKQINEEIIRDTVASGAPINAIMLRYFNPIGAHPTALLGELPNGVPQNLIPYLTQTAIGIREKLSVFGDDYDTPDGSCIRDFINVVDLAKAHVIAIRRILEKTQKEKVEVFNIGTGRGVSVLELINGFEKATGVKLNYQIVGRRAGDIEKVWANPDFANQELGWKAVETLEDTLRSAWNWQLKLRERGIQ